MILLTALFAPERMGLSKVNIPYLVNYEILMSYFTTFTPEVQRANEKNAGRHDRFISEINDSDDPFMTIVQSFSKGFATARINQ